MMFWSTSRSLIQPSSSNNRPIVPRFEAAWPADIRCQSSPEEMNLPRVGGVRPCAASANGSRSSSRSMRTSSSSPALSAKEMFPSPVS